MPEQVCSSKSHPLWVKTFSYILPEKLQYHFISVSNSICLLHCQPKFGLVKFCWRVTSQKLWFSSINFILKRHFQFFWGTLSIDYFFHFPNILKEKVGNTVSQSIRRLWNDMFFVYLSSKQSQKNYVYPSIPRDGTHFSSPGRKNEWKAILYMLYKTPIEK